MPNHSAALIFLPMLWIASPALHAEAEVYGGIGLGYSTYTINALDFQGVSSSVQEFVGLSYGDYVGIEVGFIDFHSTDSQVSQGAGRPSVTDRVETSGYTAALMGRYPLNEELAVFGKVGVIRWDSEATLGDSPFSTTASGDDLTWGAGLEFMATGPFRLRVEASVFDIDFAESWWALSASVIYGIPVWR